MKALATFSILCALLLSVACTNTASYKDGVEKALQQADLKDVTVSEDTDKNTITLGGTLHSDEAKAKAAEVAKSASNTRIIVNEVSVQPVGSETDAKNIASNLDDAIKKNYKAALIASHLDKQHISYKAKNGVLTLTGRVTTVGQRQQAQQSAAGIQNVQQVVNQIEVKR